MSAAADGQEALDKLADAEAARLAKQAKRRQAAADAHDPGENVDDFLKVFEAEFSTIKEAIGCKDFVDNVEKATKHFDELTERCARLNETLASASVFLPAYTFRQRSQDLASLVSDIGTARNKIAPKKKFSFKDRKKRAAAGGGKAAATAAATPPAQPEAAAAATQDADTEPAPPPHRPQEAADAFDPEYLISHAQNRTMVLREGEIGGHDYALTDLTDCVVHLLDVVGALYIKRVTRCRIVVGCVRGSLHISDLEDCAVTIAARQVRIHRALRSKFHIFCASQPIIEHCSGLEFGPYNFSYEQYADHMEQAGLARIADSSQDVQDFQWLRQIQSPNWSTMAEQSSKEEVELRVADAAKLAALPPPAVDGASAS